MEDVEPPLVRDIQTVKSSVNFEALNREPSMGRLSNPPVYFTLAQVRFNRLLKLSDFLPNIQERLRQERFPDFSTQTQFAIEVNFQNGTPAPVPVAVERYQFGDTEKTHVFVLDQESLTLQSTDYGDFKTFSKNFMLGLDILHEAVRLDYVERIGLRYLDRVAPRKDEDLYQYLAPEIAGLSRKLPGQPVHAYSESENVVNDVKLLSRVIIQNGPLGFPPDIVPSQMKVSSKLAEYVGPHAILDNDGSIEGRSVFSSEAVRVQLTTIHDVIGEAFHAAASAHAFKVWS